MKVCIVGGVAGGAAAAARLRRLDEHMEIVILERGGDISFANCGMPYHISGTIADRAGLLVNTPESLSTRYRIDARVNHEVLSIHRSRREIQVLDVRGRKRYRESYDFLILSPGASPVVPPIEGSRARLFKTLHTLADMDGIIAHIADQRVKEALVIGGGFIGLEIVENLARLGIRTRLVELQEQVAPPFDPEMAAIIHRTLAAQGVSLHLGTSVARITGDETGTAVLRSGEEFPVDLVVCAVGVRPETGLAERAGLRMGSTGGIAVDDQMRTSDPRIFAVGDAVESRRLAGGPAIRVPLAGPAVRQARVAADAICGRTARYLPTPATSILKVFDLQAACTGLNEKTARRDRLDYRVIHLHPPSHAGYYPGAQTMTLKVLFAQPGGALLGAQGVGPAGVDKRIDVIATALCAGMGVYDLQHLELGYAPPFGSAKDPVHMAGYVGSNVLDGLVDLVTWDRCTEVEDPLFLDLRTETEFSEGSIPQAVNIPIDALRLRMSEVPRNRHIVLFCRVGIRAYLGYRILRQWGFERLSLLSGGYLTYCHYREVRGGAEGDKEKA